MHPLLIQARVEMVANDDVPAMLEAELLVVAADARVVAHAVEADERAACLTDRLLGPRDQRASDPGVLTADGHGVDVAGHRRLLAPEQLVLPLQREGGCNVAAVAGDV